MKMTRSSWGCALTLSLALLAADANLHADAATSRQTVVLENMQFTPAIAPSASWSFTPTKAGRFDYVCTFHPTMKATVVVE
jgi:plastocyanin